MRSCRIVGLLVITVLASRLGAAEPAKTPASATAPTSATSKPDAAAPTIATSKPDAAAPTSATSKPDALGQSSPAKKPAVAPQSSASKRADDDAPAKKPASKRAGPPPKGSKTKPDDNLCYQCHTNKDQWDEKDPDSLRRYLPEAKLKEDVHFKAGVTCHDCHGGNFDNDKPNVAHAEEDGFRKNKKSEEVQKTCAACHVKEDRELRKGVHVEAWSKKERGESAALDCLDCHGKSVHAMFPRSDPRSSVFIDNQVKTCGGCHDKELEEYKVSVHGLGLYKMGLVMTAACADCHGAHGIYRAADERSTIHDSHVADTCGKCHRFIEERLIKSVHGQGAGPGKEATRVTPGGIVKRKPSCTSCHARHDLANPESAAFRQELPNRCGNCHTDLAKRFSMSTHGQLTELGYSAAAKCADCHSAHDILPLNDPHSTLAPGNRVKTCAKCHLHAVANFADYDPHADHTSSERSPLLHNAFIGMEILLYSVFGFFGLHAMLWFVRSLIHTLKHGRPKRIVPGRPAFVRFEPIHRTLHVIVIVSFLGLALTGLPLKYSNQPWAHAIASALGGFDSTSIWHRICAAATVFYFVTHFVWMSRRVVQQRIEGVRWTSLLFGPDSPVPNFRDIRDFFNMMRWFFGLGPKPTFDRWTYWEKFDYWAVFWGVAIIGVSGLMLWFPNLFTRFLPGGVLNLAKMIHSEEALLATGFVFAIHFFNTHLRAEKFPMDMAVLTGLVSAEEMEDERPDWLERLRREGKLDDLRSDGPTRRHLWIVWIGGFLALAVGLSLLLGMMLAGLSKT